MNEKVKEGGVWETQTLIMKKNYEQPKLQFFGKLHLLTQGTGGDVGDAGNQTMKMSDRTIKENIVRVGDHALGIGLYLFDYLPAHRDAWGQSRQFGVMADEVERVMPEAVCLHSKGYKIVNYAMLGISHTLH